jgi:hypothetical protein
MPASTAAPLRARDLRRAGALALARLCLGGCAQRPRTPDRALTCDRAAGDRGRERNPVIGIRGILGTGLVARDSPRVVWGAFNRGSADPARPQAARLIALPIGAGQALDGLRDEVAPAGALDRGRVCVQGVPVDTLAYARMLATLGAGGYRDESLGLAGAVDCGSEHFTCSQFGYDRRGDNVDSARWRASSRRSTPTCARSLDSASAWTDRM